jgi:hypothetical protein
MSRAWARLDCWTGLLDCWTAGLLDWIGLDWTGLDLPGIASDPPHPPRYSHRLAAPAPMVEQALYTLSKIPVCVV